MVCYSDLDLWALKVDQLKHHMKELGIFKGCSSMKKEALIEKIKAHNKYLTTEEDEDEEEKTERIAIGKNYSSEIHIIDDQDNKKRKYTPTKKEMSISPKKEKIETSDDSFLLLDNCSSFDRLGSPKSRTSSRGSTLSSDVSPIPFELPTSPPESSEKRCRRFIAKCSRKVEQRIERALVQKLYLVERKIKNQFEQEFIVFGSTGNLYSVVIGQEPSCSCPDFKGGNRCKHMLFIMLKVLRVDATSYLVYQNALMREELRAIFQGAPPMVPSSNLASSTAIAQYKQLNGESQRHPLSKETSCPICCDKFSTCTEQLEAEFCHNCGINVHKDCLQTWKGFKSTFPCPSCKETRMGHDLSVSSTSSQSSAQSRVRQNEGYLNLSEFQPGTRSRREDYTRWY